MLYIIVNPASKTGLGKKCFEELKEKLNHNHILYEAEYTDKKKGAKPAVSKFLELMKSDVDDKPVLAVLGGDGTMNGVVSELEKLDEEVFSKKKIAIAYLPTGSSNDLARSLKMKMDTDDFVKRYKAYKEGKANPTLDFGHLQVESGKKFNFTVSCGIGFDAAVCKEALDSPIKSFLNKLHLGKLTYAAIALKEIFTGKLTGLNLYLDEGEVHHFDKVLFAVAMIEPYEGGGIKMTPMADCHDGKFDIMVVHDIKNYQMLFLLPLAFFGLHTKAKQISFYKSTKAVLEVEDSLVVHADGEYCGTVKRIEVECVKDGLLFI